MAVTVRPRGLPIAARANKPQAAPEDVARHGLLLLGEQMVQITRRHFAVFSDFCRRQIRIVQMRLDIIDDADAMPVPSEERSARACGRSAYAAPMRSRMAIDTRLPVCSSSPGDTRSSTDAATETRGRWAAVYRHGYRAFALRPAHLPP